MLIYPGIIQTFPTPRKGGNNGHSEENLSRPGQRGKSAESALAGSDNEFSLQKIKENFDIIHNDTNNLNKTEHGGVYYNYQLDNMHREFFWVDSFVDMLSLSRCGVLLYKLSNLNNTSLFFSKTLTKFYKI